GFTPNVISTSLNSPVVIPAGDSIAVDLYFSAGPASLGGMNGSFKYFLSGDTLEQQVSLSSLCLPAGTSCTDGDNATINDREDGNCNCQGTPTSSGNLFSLNINCGGSQFVSSSSGKTFAADQFFFGGTTLTTTSPIQNTNDQTLFESARIGKNMRYKIPVPAPSLYHITLHFAEIQKYLFGTGNRVFDLVIEGNLIAEDLDIYKITGGLEAYSLSFTILVNDGELNINTAASINNSLISAIEILEIGTAKNAFSNSIAQEDFSNLQFDMYPNPLQSSATLNISLGSDAAVQVYIRNVQGAAVFQRKWEAGASIHQIGGLGLNPGVYLLQLVQDGKWQQKKLLIQ
ncbi:MAG: hypothetical protein ACJAZH_001251, partial [Roseivirga sp.]